MQTTVAPASTTTGTLGSGNLNNYFAAQQQYLSGATPIYGANGGITGWNSPNAAAATAAIAPGPVYSPTTNTYNSPSTGAPVWNAASSTFTNASGQPYSGTYNGVNYSGGQSQQQLSNSPSVYQALNITKSAPIASATSGLLNSFNQGANLTSGDFSNFLNEAQNATNASTTGFNNDQAAYNLSPLTSTLNSLNTGYAAAGSGLNSSFGNTGNALNQDYSAVLNNLDNQETGDISQANSMLGQYDTAANNIGNMQTQALEQNLSRYALGSGTPTGLSSGEEQALIQGVGNIELPLQQAEIGQAYNVLNNTQIPLQQQEAQGQIGQITGMAMPLAQTEYGQGENLLNQNYQNQAGTAQNLQNLALQIAGKPEAEAVQYMQSLGVPQQIQQQLLSGNVGNLAGLSSLYSGSMYQGLQDNLGQNISQPQGASFNAPSGGGGGGFGGGNTVVPFNSGGAILNQVGQAGNPTSIYGNLGNATAANAPIAPYYAANQTQNASQPAWTQNPDGTYTNNQDGQIYTFDEDGNPVAQTTDIAGDTGE